MLNWLTNAFYNGFCLKAVDFAVKMLRRAGISPKAIKRQPDSSRCSLSMWEHIGKHVWTTLSPSLIMELKLCQNRPKESLFIVIKVSPPGKMLYLIFSGIGRPAFQYALAPYWRKGEKSSDVMYHRWLWPHSFLHASGASEKFSPCMTGRNCLVCNSDNIVRKSGGIFSGVEMVPDSR